MFSALSSISPKDQTIQMSFCPNSAPSEVVVFDERLMAKFITDITGYAAPADKGI